jgi:hypothetical protein
MKLYNVPPRTWIRFDDQKLFFHRIDGMYSVCTLTKKLEYDKAIHLIAWAEVEIVHD